MARRSFCKTEDFVQSKQADINLLRDTEIKVASGGLIVSNNVLSFNGNGDFVVDFKSRMIRPQLLSHLRKTGKPGIG